METIKDKEKFPAKTSGAEYPTASYFNAAGLFLLILLWSYAAFVKLADLPLFQRQMTQQPFSGAVILVLIYAVPILEAFTAILLILNQKKLGLLLSMLLLCGFTIYVILALNHFFPETPCSCGGLIAKMSWKTHLWFNIFFIIINANCLYVELKKKGERPAQY
nr:MauE/DoxX family redox-associated membrane protein [uncultured Pedobacter sp.]